MRIVTGLTLLLMLALPIMAGAGDEAKHVCPANRAAEKGFDAYKEFHLVIAPLWHEAWPEKDHKALVAAAPDLEKVTEAIAQMQPDITSETRMATFITRRDTLVQLVKTYVRAAKEGDGETCYAVLPELHDAFELSASALSPIRYPELTGLLVTSNIIVEQHIPDENTEGIKGSTETLVRKVKALMETPLPEELSYREERLREDYDELMKLVTLMRECCDRNDMEQYRSHATTFNQRLSTIIETNL
jgi:hypothetical protein